MGIWHWIKNFDLFRRVPPEDPDHPQHWCPVNSDLYRAIQDRLKAHLERDYWDASNRTRLADDIDALALSADDPGPDNLVMAVDQLRRIANGLRVRRSFSPPQVSNALAGYIKQDGE